MTFLTSKLKDDYLYIFQNYSLVTFLVKMHWDFAFSFLWLKPLLWCLDEFIDFHFSITVLPHLEASPSLYFHSYTYVQIHACLLSVRTLSSHLPSRIFLFLSNPQCGLFNTLWITQLFAFYFFRIVVFCC